MDFSTKPLLESARNRHFGNSKMFRRNIGENPNAHVDNRMTGNRRGVSCIVMHTAHRAILISSASRLRHSGRSNWEARCPCSCRFEAAGAGSPEPSPAYEHSCAHPGPARCGTHGGRNCKSRTSVATGRLCLHPPRTHAPPTNLIRNCLLHFSCSTCFLPLLLLGRTDWSSTASSRTRAHLGHASLPMMNLLLNTLDQKVIACEFPSLLPSLP